MKLLFDHNLSHKLVQRLADVFPDSTHTRLLNFSTATDDGIWTYAKQHGFDVVTLDADFYDLSILRGPPPKLIWLRCGNSTVDQIARLLRSNARSIEIFAADPTAACLDIF
jgi:predicted nuclease of predicted toxin-antitoxin system